MKILVMPDAHLHVELLERLTALLEEHPDWGCVSLGDWADDWGKPVSAYKRFFEELRKFLAVFNGRISCCWGNHDYGYYDYPYHCSGYSTAAEAVVKDFFRSAFDDWNILEAFPRVLVEQDNVLFSHAGITLGLLKYYKSCCHRFPNTSFFEWINGPLSRNQVRLWDEYSPLWHRPSDNYRKNTFNPKYLQVVGHTPVPTITYTGEDNIIYTDTWSTDSSLTPLGDKSLLLIDSVTTDWEVIK